MKTSHALQLGALFLTVSCGQDAGTAQRPAAPASSQAAASSSEKSARPVTSTVVANDYSGGGYDRGVQSPSASGGMFYFLAASEKEIPFKVGSTLAFAKSGPAKVTRIDFAPQGGKTAVFVHVDKALDAAGDGYPNAIRVQ